MSEKTRHTPDMGKAKCMERDHFSWALKKEQDLETWGEEWEMKENSRWKQQ